MADRFDDYLPSLAQTKSSCFEGSVKTLTGNAFILLSSNCSPSPTRSVLEEMVADPLVGVEMRLVSGSPSNAAIMMIGEPGLLRITGKHRSLVPPRSRLPCELIQRPPALAAAGRRARRQ